MRSGKRTHGLKRWRQVVTDTTQVLKLHDEPEAQQHKYAAMLMRARAQRETGQLEKAKVDIRTLVSWVQGPAAPNAEGDDSKAKGGSSSGGGGKNKKVASAKAKRSLRSRASPS